MEEESETESERSVDSEELDSWTLSPQLDDVKGVDKVGSLFLAVSAANGSCLLESQLSDL